MVKKRKGQAKKSATKRKPTIVKKSKPKKKRAGDVDVLKSDVSDEALERAGGASSVTNECTSRHCL